MQRKKDVSYRQSYLPGTERERNSSFSPVLQKNGVFIEQFIVLEGTENSWHGLLFDKALVMEDKIIIKVCKDNKKTRKSGKVIS